jgi:hypothetical protein
LFSILNNQEICFQHYPFQGKKKNSIVFAKGKVYYKQLLMASQWPFMHHLGKILNKQFFTLSGKTCRQPDKIKH